MSDQFKVLNDSEIEQYKKELEADTQVQVEKELIKNKKLKYKKEFGKYDGIDKVVNSQILRDYYNQTQEKVGTFNSGLIQLDDKCGGFEEGELVVVSGITGNGKTLLAKTLTHSFGLDGVNSLWFTYEEQPKTFLRRFKAMHFPIFYLPSKLVDNKLSWIEKRIIESKVKYFTKCVFIDHLHFLIPIQESKNTSMLVGGIMRELKKIALKHDIVLFILAHTHKIKQEETPDLSNLRDSSFIAQEADKVFIIRRKGKKVKGEVEFTDISDVYVLKNRLTGQLGKIAYRFSYETGFLQEVR